MAVSLKSLTVQGDSRAYKFLVNYWLYYVGIQYLHHIFKATIICLFLETLKLWLFYGKFNNLQSLNFTILGFFNEAQFSKLEEKVNLGLNCIGETKEDALGDYFNSLAVRPIDNRNLLDSQAYLWQGKLEGSSKSKPKWLVPKLHFRSKEETPYPKWMPEVQEPIPALSEIPLLVVEDQRWKVYSDFIKSHTGANNTR